MKLGEIKIEALKLMFVNQGDSIAISNSDSNGSGLDLSEIANDPQYRDYYVNMNGSINRCFAVLESRKILPTKRSIPVRNSESTEYMKEVDLSYLEFDDIQRVTRKSATGYDAYIDYFMEGNTIIIPVVNEGDTIAIIYYPKIKRIKPTESNDTEIDVPDKIATAIPYYVKYDLFREDNESEANEAIRMFGEYTSLITQRTDSYQGSVDSVMGFWEV